MSQLRYDPVTTDWVVCAPSRALRPHPSPSLAQLLRAVLLKLYMGLDNPSFNLTIDSVSRGDESKEYFMWHLRILPRLTTTAGFEMGSGMSINTVLREDARNFLCEVATVENHAQQPSLAPVHA